MRRLAYLAGLILLWSIGASAQPAVPAGQATERPTIRPISERLPQLWVFLKSLDADVTAGRLKSTGELIAKARAFYTGVRMAAIERVVPGWGHMGSYDDGKTLWHINVAMVALFQLDEYQAMVPAGRIMQEWIVLLHDLAKEPAGGRDHRHGFRSGALAGRVLPGLGFPVTEAYAAQMPAWFALTDGAVRLDLAKGYPIHDNTKLPQIMAGASRIFADPTLTAVKAITLHQSITSLASWPVAAPIARTEAAAYVDPDLYPALLALTLADSGGWNLFDPARLAAMYKETRGIFARLPGAARGGAEKSAK